MTPSHTVADISAIQDRTLLRRVAERNPGLIEAAFKLHRDRKVPPNSWIIDLDAIAANADALSAKAGELGLSTYVMTKQYNRNPVVTSVAIKHGLHKGVAVDIHCARVMHRYGVPVGHIGHLNQVPAREIEAAIAIGPEVITVYSVENARMISGAAQAAGVTQDLMVRPIGEGDVFFVGQEGGFPEEDVIDAARAISQLPNVRIVGVTSFPCVRYNFGEAERAEPQANPNLATVARVAQALRNELGLEITQLNTPGNTAVETLPLLAAGGSTHVEPGHGLIGTTPNHILDGTQPEVPAYVYLSEVSHHYQGRAYAFGGGFWTQITGLMRVSGVEPPMQALVGADLDGLLSTALDFEPQDQVIDYHGALYPGEKAAVGDTVVMALYTQAQMTRSYTVPVSGISTGEPEAHGIFDVGTHLLDDGYAAVPAHEARKMIERVVERY
ncbi:MAG: amino acid racemase [Chthonomonadaceae bacterium]|nr:amino acid racemase [Chthonomonadaceae bacterium]